ncbi:hypothetical protein BCV72DRAFT_236078 [Rhizopus microsporus var. microsporus]|uniref:Uncharacterized protein n=2 Tax=Rhizopus microsporus TaxID=58291 RepID=A0A2G4SLI9_RHIZD|nr:uncharacterized protein RHIMIDRAFT_261899 [Rhizopus microsporus ATCC 52813]ORE01602.1 hypothetical protein BCV72DRAFT_236078 [Rhizopus microsporus var. microsporus]PHZ09631.1 hypothetical protein RHIMIDRAFT_261899 [Rhizopus microsporus ATCC 52813]
MKNHKAKRRAQSEQRESPNGETYSHALISLFSLVTDVKNEITELRKEQQTSRERMISLQEQIARLSGHIDPNQVRSPSLSHSTTNSDGNGERSRQDNNRLYGTTDWSPYYVGDATRSIVYNGPLGPYMYNPSYSHLSSNATNSHYIPQATRRPPSSYFTQSLPHAKMSSAKLDKSSPSRTESRQEEPHNDPASPVEQNLEHTLSEQEEENQTSSRRVTRSSTKPNQQRVTTRRSSLANAAKKRAPPKLPSSALPPKRRARTVKSYRIVSDSETESTDESEQDPTEEINVGNKKQNNREKNDSKNKSNGKTSKATQDTPALDQQSKEMEEDNERNANDQETKNSEQGAYNMDQNKEDASTQEKEQENLPESAKLREDAQNTVVREAPSSQRSSSTSTVDKPLIPVVIPAKHIPKRYGRQTVNPKTTLVDGDFFGIISMKQKEEAEKQKNGSRSSSDISIDSRENLKPSEILSIQSVLQNEHAKDITHETVNDTQDIAHVETRIVKEQVIGIEGESEAETRSLKTKKANQSSVNYDSDASGLSYLSATDNNTDTEADYNTYRLTAKDESTPSEKMARAKELEFELTPEEQLASEGLLTPLIRVPLDASKSTADVVMQKANLKKNSKKRVFEREVKLLGVEKKEIKKLGDYRERKLRPRFEKKRLHIY